MDNQKGCHILEQLLYLLILFSSVLMGLCALACFLLLFNMPSTCQRLQMKFSLMDPSANMLIIVHGSFLNKINMNIK